MLHYAIDDAYTFTETIAWPSNTPFANYNQQQLDAALSALHIAAGISYFKTFLPTSITVSYRFLSPAELQFWHTVYTKGLGEFWYVNQLDPTGKITFKNTQPEPSNDGLSSLPERTKITNPLVPIGGGKDSIVTIELLKKAGFTPTLFRVGSHPLITKQAEIAGLELLNVERTLDTKLQQLNNQGAYNGHIPVTAINSCIATVTSILYGYDSVLLSNERSANEGNTTYHGLDVNHQWSKSLEFEALFRDYLEEQNITVQYLSDLRSLSEIQITTIFCKYPEYLPHSTSCNANWRIWKDKPTSLWGTDAKSAFVFALYSIFLSEAKLLKVFGKNLFNEPATQPHYRQLLGLEELKPFECVGTPNETMYAFARCMQQSKWQNSLAMQLFKAEVADKPLNMQAIEAEVLTSTNEHFLPPELEIFFTNPNEA